MLENINAGSRGFGIFGLDSVPVITILQIDAIINGSSR